MKLAIVMPATVSLPLISGGGVERLCEMLLLQNETSECPAEITVISAFDDRCAELAGKYKHTKFLYVKIPRSEPRSNALKSKLLGRAMRYDYLSGAIKLLRGADFDTLMLENCPEFAASLCKKFKIRPILHAHDRFLGRDKIYRLKDISMIKRFIFTSEHVRSSMLKCGIPEKMTSLVTIRVDTSEFDAAKYEAIRRDKREQYGLSDDDLLCIFVGKLTPEKGALELVKAMSASEYRASKMRLLIVGSAQYGMNIQDDYRNELEFAAAKGRVIFIGSVKSASAARFLARADIAIIPTITNDAGGLAVIEALSSGLPLIVSDSEGLREYTNTLSDNICTRVSRGLGYTEALRRAIDGMANKLHSAPDTRASLSNEARAHAERFTSAGYYDAFMEEIKK